MKILGLIDNINEQKFQELLIIIIDENINQEFRLRKIDEPKNCFLEEIKHNYLISKKHTQFVIF